MIINETQQKLEIFAQHFCDFCREQFYPTPYRSDGKCYICNQDICKRCSTELQTNAHNYEGDFSWKSFCPDCNRSLDIYNHVVNTAEKEMEDAEERKDNAINNRWSVIENYRKNWQAQP